MASDLPRQLGPYRLERRLGQGGMSEVFLARAFGASGFEKRVVLKVMLPELLGDATYERMFLEEARIGALLSHQNLVGVHELGIVDGVYFARIDFVDGCDLATLLHLGPMPEAVALFVADELARGLHAVHSARDLDGAPLGLVHRDVSPSNVLLSRAGEVKLADFGISKATLARDQTRAGVRKGTYAYMSPEQVSGRALSAQSDLFALGAVLFEMLVGRPAFEGATPMETMDRVREAAVELPSTLGEAVSGILRTLLAKMPAARPADARAVSELLRTLRGSQGGFAVDEDLAPLVGRAAMPA